MYKKSRFRNTKKELDRATKPLHIPINDTATSDDKGNVEIHVKIHHILPEYDPMEKIHLEEFFNFHDLKTI